MSYTECRACGEEVHKKAKTCQHCNVGNPGFKFSFKTALKYFLIMLSIIFAFLIIIAFNI